MGEIALHAGRPPVVLAIVRPACHLLLVLMVCGVCLAGVREAERVAEQARKAERTGRIVEAYLLYSQAIVLDPRNLEYRARAEALRARATLISREKLPPSGVVSEAQPGRARADNILPEATAEPTPPPVALPLPRLKPFDQKRTLDLRGDARALFLQAGRIFGLEPVFDSDYPPSPPVNFYLEDAGWEETIRALETVTGSFVVPLGERKFLVVRDTPQKRQEREPHVTVVVSVPDLVTPQEVQEVRAAVQQVMQVTRIGFDPARRLLVLRERASLAWPAQALLEQLLQRKPVVSIEVELVEVNRQFTTAFGAFPPSSYLLTALGRPWNSPPWNPGGFTRFAVFGGGKSLVGFGIPDVQMLAQMSRAVGQNLFRAQLRSLEGQAASLHVGERFPIVTAKEIAPDANTPLTYPPAFVFEDLGLVLKATPRVHGLDEITLTLETSYKALTGQVVEEIPVISNRSYQSEIRLRNGEWAVVAGLMSSSEARTITGLAGVSRIPVLNYLLNMNTRERSQTEILLLIRPRLLSLPVGERRTEAIPTGTETRPRVPL